MHQAISEKRVAHCVSQCAAAVERVRQLLNDRPAKERSKIIAVVTDITFELTSAIILLDELQLPNKSEVDRAASWRAAQKRIISARHTLIIAQDSGKLPLIHEGALLSIEVDR